MIATPSITLALFTYNHEDYISESIEGVLAQDYTNLEIVISDDCSTDNTWQIIQEKLKDYKGPHKITLNKNEVNLGIGSHVNKLFELSSSDLVIIAAGDDISLPNRVSLLTNEWLEHQKPIYMLSNFYLLSSYRSGDLTSELSIPIELPDNVHERLLEYATLRNPTPIKGATEAFSKELYHLFGKLNDDVIAEDIVFYFRAILSSSFHFVDQPLVVFRNDQNRTSEDYGVASQSKGNSEYINKSQRFKVLLPSIKQMCADFQKVKQNLNLTPRQIEQIELEFKNSIQIRTLWIEWYDLPLLKRFALFLKVIVLKGRKQDIRWSIKNLF